MSTTPNNNSKNILNSDVELKGNLKFAGELIFDGKLDGDISSEGILNLGDNAVSRAHICHRLPMDAGIVFASAFSSITFAFYLVSSDTRSAPENAFSGGGSSGKAAAHPRGGGLHRLVE